MSGEDEGSSGKKMGPIAAVIAAIGMFMARAGDDCARIGAKGAMLGDDAARGLGRAGSLADDGLRGGGKLGSLADDGLRGGGKLGPLADDGMRAGAKGPLPGMHGPTPEGGGGLVEEAMSAGAKAESHAGDLAELGVDVSMEILSNVGPSDGDDEDEGDAPVVDGVRIPRPASVTSAQNNPADLLRMRSVASSPMLLGLAPGAPKTIANESEPFAWLASHTAQNPVGLLYASRGKVNTKSTISLVSSTGEKTDDAAIHRTCLELTMNCVVLVCEPDAAGAKEPCVKGAVAAWKSVEALDLGAKPALRDFLGKLLLARAGRPSLRNLVLSRLDVEATPPRIVRSRIETKATSSKP
ncbi:hypothetical protein [Polyangium sp. 6x1]|uniref:hypothetical protein n=1 Tax=Polyangium sp. 6x1 TaxID=3042689 RepID=UPI0024832D0C|nr:hypothetical protein [Polyangium sp. 6x1]MDI1446426.1 hypothetical protein [Polyangium sp. 6x1]